MQTSYLAGRTMIIADWASIMYLQTVAFAYENIYVAICAINVDYETSYVIRRAI